MIAIFRKLFRRKKKEISVAPGMPLASRILTLAATNKIHPIPEIGHSVSLIASAECWNVSDSHLRSCIKLMRETEDFGYHALDRYAHSDSDPIWIEFPAGGGRPARGALVAPDPNNPGRIVFSGWTMGVKNVPFWIPLLAEWRNDVNASFPSPPSSPADRVVFRNTPGTKKMFALFLESGEFSEKMTISDFCSPMLDLVLHSLSIIIDHNLTRG